MLVSTVNRVRLCSVFLLAGLAACGGSSTETDGGVGGGVAGSHGGRSGSGGGLGRGGMVGTGGGVAGASGSGAAGGTIGTGGAIGPGGTAGTEVVGSGGMGGGGTVGTGGTAGGPATGSGGSTGGAGAGGSLGGRGGTPGMAGRGGAAGAMGGRGGAGGRGGMGGAGGATVCANGTHRCGNSCVADNSIASGCTANGCTACRDTDNGDPVCRGNSCDISCQSQFHGCGSAATRTCVRDNNTSNTSCGNTCMACPTMTGGTSTCDGTKCVPHCNQGFHLCNGACVSNSSATMCGTDDGDCQACPTGETCTNAGSCQTTSCPAPNQHICGNMCVDQSVAQCGANCATCPTPTADKNTVATCTTTGMCRNVCRTASFHRCGGTDTDPTCKSNNDVATCGSSCNPCSPATVTNGTVGCNGTACTLACDQNFHQCWQDSAQTIPVCLSNTSNDSCGNRCIPCAAGTTCQNGACMGAGGAAGSGG
jgi:hypothetical protein